MKLANLGLASLISLSLFAACTKKDSKASLPDSAPAAAPTAAPQAEAPAAQQAPAAPAAAPAAAGTPPPEFVEGSAPVPAANAQQGVQLTFPGAVSSQRQSKLSFRVSGYVDTIKKRAGTTCKKGDLLATLDPRDYQLQVDLAKSNLNLAQVAAANALAEFKREEELKAQNASSGSAFDKMKATYDNAKVNVDMADLKLKQAQQALGDTRLVAPYNCVIAKQLLNISESVKPGDPVYEVYDVTDIELSFNVPERMAGQLKVGQKMNVRIPATGYQGELDIARVVTVVDEKTRTFQIVAKAPQNDERIVPGLYAEGVVK